ncbi:hypothetical protein [Kitasatospora sp. NPDC058478]|uniref:hypothetical protein n=1 Tax=unclassified Kitasatospora TaxID=2633591 RepID=UPI00365A953B
MSVPNVAPATSDGVLAEIGALTKELASRLGFRVRTSYDDHRITVINARLRTLYAIAPSGYALPTKAGRLAQHARTHGWTADIRWSHGNNRAVHAKHVSVVLDLRRPDVEHQPHPERSGLWMVTCTWHGGYSGGDLVYRGGHMRNGTEVHNAPALNVLPDLIEANSAIR